MSRYEEPVIKYMQQNTPKLIIEFLDRLSGTLYTKYTGFIIVILFIFKIISITQFISLILINYLLIIIKNIFTRIRPFRNNKEITLYDTHEFDDYSFPSGHATFSFLIYFILNDNQFINNYFIIIPILISLSRVILGVHYISDVLIGIVIAKCISLLVRKPTS